MQSRPTCRQHNPCDQRGGHIAWLGGTSGESAAETKGVRMRHSKTSLLNHLVGTLQKPLWDHEPERFCSLEVYDQFELRRLLDRQVGGLRSLEYPVHVRGSPPNTLAVTCSVRHETTSLHILLQQIHRRQAVLCCERDYACALGKEYRTTQHDQCVRPVSHHCGEGTVEIARSAHIQHLQLHVHRTPGGFFLLFLECVG